MASVITPTQFENLKREAKKQKRAFPSLTHSAALDELAAKHGYANWSLLAKSVGTSVCITTNPTIPIPLREHSLRVSGFVRLRDRPYRVDRFWHQYLPAKYPAAHYIKSRRIPEDWDVVRTSEESVVHGIESVQRVLAFMDATDLRPSSAFRSLLPSDISPVGLDHFSVWRDGGNRYVISNEPYRSSDKRRINKEWCETNGWSYQEMPQGIGMHNACTPECDIKCGAHTILILMSPPKRGVDLTIIGDALIANFGHLNSTKIEIPIKTVD